MNRLPSGTNGKNLTNGLSAVPPPLPPKPSVLSQRIGTNSAFKGAVNKIPAMTGSTNTRSLLVARIRSRYGAKTNAMIKNKTNANLIKILSPNTVTNRYRKFTTDRRRKYINQQMASLKSRHNSLNAQVQVLKKRVQNAETTKARIRNALVRMSNNRRKLN